jgi:crotonobetainyl-CoA:carnitine CoA-transferase CaiB-like acyl-CoA transferase
MFLAEMGANVIKIENPDSPDQVRMYPPHDADGNSINYKALNRSKKSWAVDLRTEEGRQAIYDLIPSIDVLIEQFRPETMCKYGLDYESLKKINPRLLYVSLTGYGQTGEYAQKAGHDLNFLAYSGLLSLNTDEKGKPVIPAFQLADIAGGSYMCIAGVLAGLFARERKGIGQKIDISMLDACLPLLSLPYAHQKAGETIRAGSTPLSGQFANYNVYRCADGKYIALAALEPKFWIQFCQLVEKSSWIEQLFSTSPQELIDELNDFFAQKTREEWIHSFAEYDICISPVLSIEELDTNAHFIKRNILSKGEIVFPIHFSATPVGIFHDAPELGSSNDRISHFIKENRL